MSLAILLLLLAAQDASPPPVPDAELATQRGGFMLPGGIDVALTVQTQTSLNGAVVLRSVFRADQGVPTLTVYAPRPGEVVAAGTTAAVGTGTATMPTVTYDSRTGILVTGGATAVPTVALGSAIADDVAAGLVRVDPGQSVTTDNGIVTQTDVGGVQTAALRGLDLSVTHLAGSVFGSAIANAGSDRAIDTQTTLGIDLRGLDSTIMASAMLRVEDVATGAMLNRQ